MSAADVVIERETANDEFATIVAIHVASGCTVAQGEPIFDVENSKATEEVQAPQSGVLVHDLQVGKAVSFGSPIARIMPLSEHSVGPCDAAPEPPPIPAVTPEPPVLAPTRPVLRRTSRAATALLSQHELSAADFDVDFLTTREVLTALRQSPERQDHPAERTLELPLASGQAPGRAKQMEIESLSCGAGATMLSVLGTRLGKFNVRRAAGAFLTGRITDLVIYESSRLMRKFPRLNASYQDGQVYRHPAIHAGLAIDGDERLVVYGITNSDTRNLADISGAITDAATRYASKSLRAVELSRATFTVTDLSADNLDFIFPLLPRGQTTIIGITHDDQDGYRLFAGFDHRVTEGREVAQFLSELRERLLSFSVVGGSDDLSSCCAYCMRSVAEVVSKSRDRGLVKIVDRNGLEQLCCASCWNGW